MHSAKEKVEEKPQSQSPKQAEPQHEGPLLDNKVTALRVQEALKKAGAGFEQVEVHGSAAGVTMSGTVKSAAERNRAEEIAKSVHREMKLKNEIKIGR